MISQKHGVGHLRIVCNNKRKGLLSYVLVGGAECDQDSALQALDHEVCLARRPFLPILEARKILDRLSAGSVRHGGPHQNVGGLWQHTRRGEFVGVAQSNFCLLRI